MTIEQNDPFLILKSALDRIVTLSQEEWEILRTYFVPRTAEARTLLVGEGQVAQEIYFISSGLARLYYQTKDGNQITAFIFTENMFASSMESFLKQEPGIQYLDTLENTSLLVLTKQGLDELYEKLPVTYVIMRKVMEARFIASQRLLASYILASPQQRYELFAQSYPELVQRVPQYILASFLGITPVSLSRIRNRIAKQS